MNKLKYFFFALSLVIAISSCDTASVRPDYFVLATGNVYTELYKNKNTNKTEFRTCFLGTEFYNTVLESGIAITPTYIQFSGTYPLEYTSSDSSVLFSATPYIEYDSLEVLRNVGLYKFYLLSGVTGERSYTVDTIKTVAKDSVVTITYENTSQVSDNIHLEWDPYPNATDYQVVIHKSLTGELVYNSSFLSSDYINFLDITKNDPGWIELPVRGTYYEVRLYAFVRNLANRKIKLSTYDQYLMLY